jgi:hypothetical protein
MSELIITPEISLQLERAVNAVGLTKSDLHILLRPEILESVLPFLMKRAKVVLHNPLPLWDEIEIAPRIVTGADFVSVLEEEGIKDTFFSFEHVRATPHVGVQQSVVYELFAVTLKDLFLYCSTPYQRVLKRAMAIGIHDGSAPPVLVAELLLQKKIKAERREFRYRIPTRLVPSSLFGTVSLGVGNGFRPEDPSDTSLSLEEPLFLAYPSHETEDVVYINDTLIFSRVKQL